MNYEYDGTFFGFLSAVFDAWHDGIEKAESIRTEGSLSLFDEPRSVCTDPGKARRILEALRQQCSGRACHFLYYAFMAELPDREDPLLLYLRLAFRYKNKFLHHLSDEPIWTVRQMARKTGNERHKLLGLLRFRELSDGMLYARLAPSCAVVPLMAPHFVSRFPEERWVIHDVRRHMGVLYESHCLSLIEIPQTMQELSLSRDEQGFNQLWQTYYQTISIKERRNDTVRRSFMPEKYWPWLIEDAKHS